MNILSSVTLPCQVITFLCIACFANSSSLLLKALCSVESKQTACGMIAYLTEGKNHVRV